MQKGGGGGERKEAGRVLEGGSSHSHGLKERGIILGRAHATDSTCDTGSMHKELLLNDGLRWRRWKRKVEKGAKKDVGWRKW